MVRRGRVGGAVRRLEQTGGRSLDDGRGMATLAEAWNSAASALPAGWRLEGLRCTSTGLKAPDRGDDWIAEACGPNGECVTVESSEPHAALATLTDKLDDYR